MKRWGKIALLYIWYLSLLGLVISLLATCIPSAKAYVGDQHTVHTVISADSSVRSPDISFNPNTGKYLVIWEQWSSGDNWDIYARILNEDGSYATALLPISTTGDFERNPRVACANSNLWVVVWSQSSGIGNGIQTCVVGEDGDVNNCKFITTGLLPREHPDIGGSAINDEFLIVWQEMSDLLQMYEIRGRLFSALSGVQGDELVIGSSYLYNRKMPSVNQRGGNYFVAWETELDSSTVRIDGRYVSYDGNMPYSDFTIDASGINGEASVASRGDINDFLVAWHKKDSDNNSDIEYAFTGVDSVLLNGAVTSTASTIEKNPFAAYTGISNTYLIGYAKASDLGGNWDICCKMLERGSPADDEETIAAESINEGNPEGSTVGGSYGKVLVVWDRNNGYDIYIDERDWTVLCPAPEGPDLFSPPNGAAGISMAALLDWDDVSGATSYDVQVCSDSDCSSVVRSANALNSSQCSVSPALSPGTQYWWRARANNSCGTGSWSSIRSFTTCQVLNPPSQGTPLDGNTVNTLTPKLEWNTVMGATNFDVQVCTDMNCSPPVRERNTGVNLSEWTVSPALDPVTTYYWRVRANNACGPGPWRALWSFTTFCPTPGTPLNNVPSNGATGVSISPTLSWLASTNTDSYDVYCDESSNPQTLRGTTTNTSLALSDLSCNVTYYWKIVAKNTCGNSKTGSVSHFATGPTPGTPLNPFPSNGATGVATSLTLSWSAGSNADSYDIYLGTTSPPPYLDNTATPNYAVSGLSGNTTHYWKIVAKSKCGKSTSGAVWNFKTYLPGVLSVTPSDGLSSSGPQGGPFIPLNKVYTLKNTGGVSIDWTTSLAGSSNWITLSSSSGALAPNATTSVTLSINSNANSLASGANYSDTVYFANATNGNGNTSRVVDVTVYPPGILGVTPSDGLSSSGPQGGPFSPSNKSYTLNNTGGFSINWSASLAGSSNWITLSSTSGALDPNATTSVTVSINANANNLASGFNYSDTVSFTNTTNGNGDASRGVDLTVSCPTPGTPSSPSPPDGAAGVATNSTLIWANSTNTGSYDVYLATSTEPLYVANTTNTAYSPSTLNPTTLYYWKIVAKNTCGNFTSGPVWSFTTAVASPLAPTLASPTNNATRVSITPTLSWNASSGADSYRLQVSTNNTFATTVFDQDGMAGTSQSVTGLLNNTTYYWRVGATNAGGMSAWSTTWSFTTIVTSVVVSGRQLVVNGNPFTIRGVGYSPVPICDDPETMSPNGDYFTSGHSAVYNRDLPLLRQMGANTIRLWGWNNTADHLDFLDNAYNSGVNPIYVIVGFWIDAGLNIDPYDEINVREEIKDSFRLMVAAHKNHPAILMWAIGNELNAPDMYGGKVDYLFSLINEMAQVAHAEEGFNFHPVTTPLMDSNLFSTISTYDASVPALDIWGVNAYRGNSFGTLFSDYESVSSKPLVILEYGIDAYDHVNQQEYQDPQADCAEDLWNEIKGNSDVCIGGSIMEYSDEWWKGKHSTDPGCPDNDGCYHGPCGYVTSSHPDGYANEEWWGIMRVADNGTAPDMMEPRAAYYRLKALWMSLAETVLPPDPPSGPVSGSTAKSYVYTAQGASSNYGDPLQYFFDWGDGTNSGWLPAGQTSASKSWPLPGSYSIKAQARCGQHISVASSWSGITVTSITNDKTPPAPDPMIWQTPPYQTGANSIWMAAPTATDPTPPVSYYFDFVGSPTGGLGGADSGWQSEASYTNLYLRANHKYGYRVKAKDGLNNQTAYSTTQYAYTATQPPTGMTFGTVTATSIQARSTNTPPGLSRGKSSLLIENTTLGTDSGWKRDNTFWTSKLPSPNPNTKYGFRAKARNGDGIATDYCTEAYRYTLANSPGKSSFSNVTRTSIRANWTINGNPPGTQYLCQNLTTKTDSGWITDTFWNSDNLACGISYSFRVKAKNEDGVETAWVSLGSQSTVKCIILLTPNGGEMIPSGSSYDIQWEATPAAESFDLFYSLDSGVNWISIAKDVRNTIHPWTVPKTIGNKKACLVRVVGYNAARTKKIGSDTSDKPFTIEVVTVIKPNGGEALHAGEDATIEWRGCSDAVKFDLMFSLDNGLTWHFIDDENTPGVIEGKRVTGTSFTTKVLPPDTGNKTSCLIKVIAYNGAGKQIGSDASDKPFKIDVVTLTSPNGGGTPLKQNDITNVTWTAYETNEPITKVQLFYTKDGGVTYNLITTLSGAYPPGDYSQLWTIPPVGTTPKTKCKVKVLLKDARGVIRGSDVSDNFLTIEP